MYRTLDNNRIPVNNFTGWMAGRGAKGVRDYFVAGGRLSWILLIPFLMAEFVAVVATIGAVEMAHKDDIISLWFFLAIPTWT